MGTSPLVYIDRAAVNSARVAELFNSENFKGIVIVGLFGLLVVIVLLIGSIYESVVSASIRRALRQLIRSTSVELEAIPLMDLDPVKMTYTTLSSLDTHNSGVTALTRQLSFLEAKCVVGTIDWWLPFSPRPAPMMSRTFKAEYPALSA